MREEEQEEEVEVRGGERERERGVEGKKQKKKKGLSALLLSPFQMSVTTHSLLIVLTRRSFGSSC